MAKGLNRVQVGLDFTVDTRQAKQELNSLKNSLNEVIKMPGKASSLFDDSSIRKASESAQLLQNHLQKAVNVDTGKLDLSKFSLSLKAANQDLNSHISNLLKIGPIGQQAFLNLAKSISHAEMPTRKVNRALEEMMTTLKNTARWQISSSILHGLMGAVQKAYGYAQDLNASLNDIRIVTGYSTNEMSKFAKEANKAAKSLSTSTNEYAKASLIYYQQGLSSEDVKTRTDITIKMANVSRQSAEVVSDQMTAVWNNFDDGSKSLEYYADVMTALGAATASSTDEIAQGLEKFSAIADTVGLSYEYATSALATVTAETRQSADVVGTAFKTIFARLEGLSLGETLDDGTSLNKYSQALKTVGIDIKTASGEMKDMDSILDELGSRWQTLAQDEKIALAQTVAGVRQYNQLISLMDNWDTFQENLSTSKNSEGALANQAAIYAQSWEAAQERVQAAAEDIYDSLINDEFFIDLTNGLAKVLEAVSGLVDGFGGLKGVLMAVGSIFMSQYSQKIPGALLNLKQNMMATFGSATKEMVNTQKDLLNFIDLEKADDAGRQSKKGTDPAVKSKYAVELEGAERVSRMKIQLAQASKSLNEEELKAYENKIKAVELMNEEILKLQEKLELAEKLKKQAKEDIKASAVQGVKDTVDNYEKAEKQVSFHEDKISKLETSKDGKSASEIEEIEQKIKAHKKALEEARMEAAKYEAQITALGDAYENLDGEDIEALMSGSDPAKKDVYAKIKEESGAKTDAFGAKVDQRATVQAQQDSLGGQAKEWGSQKNALLSTKDTKKAGVELDKLKKRMQSYTEVLKKNQKSTGVSTRTLNLLSKSIDSITLEELESGFEDVENILGRLSKQMGKTIGELDDEIEKMSDELGDMKVDPESINDFSDACTTGATEVENFNNATEQTNQQASEIPETTLHASEVVGQLGTTFLAVGGMVSAVTNAIKVWGDDSATVMDKIGAGMAMLTSIGAGLNAVTSLATVLMKNESVAKTMNTMVTNKSTIAKIANAIANTFLAGTEGAVTAATIILVAILLVAVAVIVAVVAVVVKLSAAFGEQAQKELELQQRNQELINSNQELSKSVRELIDEYQEFQQTGQDTYDTMLKLKEQLPELIDSYKELERNLGIDLDVEQLEAAYQAALSSGNWNEVEMVIKQIEAEVIKAETLSYEQGSNAAGRKMADAGRKGSGHLADNDTKYRIHIGGVNGDDEHATSVLRESLNEQGISNYLMDTAGTDHNSTELEMDLTNPTTMVNYYEALQSAMSKLEAEGKTSSATYKEMATEVDELADAYAEAKPQVEALLEGYTEELNTMSDTELADLLGVDESAINSIQGYNTNLDTMVQKYAELKGITEEEAKAILQATDAISGLVSANAQLDSMAFNLAGGNSTEQAKLKEDLQGIYDSLSEEDKTLFLTLDFTELDPEHLKTSVEKAMAEAREKQIVAEVKLEAEELGFDESAFESYADVLQDTNKHLKDQEGLAYKVALQNARMSKGLVTLTENFKDNVAVLAKGNRASYEYAEAIGALKDGFEEMFGYKPSTVFIEGHLTEIQDLVNGNLDGLQNLQDELAQDYILNMEIGTSIGDLGASTEEVRTKLQTIFDSIDTSVEVGAGTEISQDYLDAMQGMLDQGQITEEQLEEVFRMKGIEMKVTGHKTVPGPKSTTYQKITSPFGTYTKTIEESSDIEVPIINGDDSEIYGMDGSTESGNKNVDSSQVATFVKSADANSIDSSAFEEANDSKERERKIKELEEEKDIYHETSRELQRLGREYDKLDKAKERAYGKQKLAYMEQQNKIREQEIQTLEEEIQAAEQLAQTLQGEGIEKYGLSFNTSTGEMANWSEVYDRELQYYKNAINSGNEEAVAEAEQRWEDFNSLVEKYNQLLDDAATREEEIAEKQAEIYDSYLEGLEYTLEIRLEIDDSQLEYLEYMLSKIEDDAFAAASQIALLGEQTAVLMDKGDGYRESINNLLSKHGLTLDQASSMSGDELLAAGFTEAEIESLREWTSGLLETNQALLENKTAIQDSLMPLYDAWGEKFDEQTAKVEHATSVLEHYQNVIDLVGKKRLGMTDQDLIDLADGQVQVANNNLQIAQNRYEAAQESRAKASEELEKAKARAAADPKNEELQKDVAYWEGVFNDLDADVREQEQNRNAMLEAALEAAAEKYRLITESILNDFEKGIAGAGKDLESLSENYSRSSEEDSRYVDNYEKMYQLNKLSRELETKLAKSNSLAEQKALREQLEKINKLKAEDVQMSEHDLEVLQKQVEVEQARIAMEEAQNAKTQVVRRRDSEGNWGYVYTADQDKSAQAAQTYEDKMYELYKTNDEYIDSLGEKIIQAQIEMREALVAINEEDFASREEYLAKVNEVTDYYNGMINYYYDEMNKSIGYNAEVYSQDLETRLGWSAESVGISNEQLVAISQIRKEDYDSLDAYYAAVEERTGLDRETIKQLDEAGTLAHIEEIGKQIGANDELQLSFEDTKYAQETEFKSMEEAQDAFTSATNTMVDNLGQAYDDHEQDIEDSLNEVGLSLEDSSEEYTNFKEHVQDEISGSDGVVAQSGEAADSTDDMKNDMVTDFSEAATAISTWQSTYSSQIGLAITANENMVTSLNTMITTLADATQALNDYANTYNTVGGGSGDGGSGGLTDVNGIIDNTNQTNSVVPDTPTTKTITMYKPDNSKVITEATWTFGKGQNSLPTKAGTWGGHKVVKDESVGDYLIESRKFPGNYIKTGDFEKHTPLFGSVYWTPTAGSFYHEKKVETFDTGGYTGQWGAEGRMAMLHQKELILNAQDTENFLLATNILRDIVSKIELSSLSSILNANMITQGLAQNLGNNFEQNVVIHAEFPDATNHNEIEEAFNNLILRASQYANRK